MGRSGGRWPQAVSYRSREKGSVLSWPIGMFAKPRDTHGAKNQGIPWLYDWQAEEGPLGFFQTYQFADFGFLETLFGNHLDAGIVELFDFFAPEMFDQDFHGHIAHLVRILDH